MMKRSIAALFIACGLAGCAGNAPLTYLILSPVPGVVYAASGPAIAVGRVAMPPAIDRGFLTEGSSETTVAVSYHAQWAAPLGPMAQTVLARDLAARLPGHAVLMPGDNVPDTALIVSVNIITFLPYPSHVVLEADWRVAGADGKTVMAGRTRITTPTTATAQAQAQAMSQGLGLLADKIAGRISGYTG